MSPMLNPKSFFCGLSLICASLSCGQVAAPRTEYRFLSAIDPDGAVERGILDATGTKRIVSLDRLFFVSGRHRNGMFVRVSLERFPDAGGIPEGVMHSHLFIVQDQVNGKARVRIIDDAFMLNTWNPETKSIKSERDMLDEIDLTDLSTLRFSYEHVVD